MDFGFKRFWSRKKSVSSIDQPSSNRKLSSSAAANVRAQSNINNTRDGITSRQLDQPFSHDRTGTTQEFSSRTSNDNYIRTKSGHRIQPMLVGISRPETGRGRPPTADSVASTTHNITDVPNRRSSEVPSALPIPTKNPRRSEQRSRHVDIFAVASSVPSHLSRYNEEIAERNLDTIRLALENTPYVYNPSSKYQEEVAIRNAYLPYKNRTSSDRQRQSTEYERTASMTNRSVRSVVSPQPNGVQSYQYSSRLMTPDQALAQEPISQHLHQFVYSGGVTQPSLMAQEDGDQNMLPQYDGASGPYSPTRSTGFANLLRDNRMQTINEGQTIETRPSTATTTGTQRTSGQSFTNGVADYKISATEYGSRPPTGRSMHSDRGSEFRNGADTGLSAPSTRPPSFKKHIVLPNRTIMDLTNEDQAFSEASSAYAYSLQYSPVIELAKSDMFQKIAPSQIHTEERRSPKGPSNAGSGQPTEQDSQHPKSVQTSSESTARTSYFPDQEYIKPASPIAFSPISTVASLPPRTTAPGTPRSELPSVNERVAAALEQSRAIARDSPLPVTPSRNRETGVTKNQVAMSNTAVDAKGMQHQTTVGKEDDPNGIEEKLVSPPTSPSTTVSAPSASTTTSASKSTTRTPTAPTIYNTPDSIKSADFINPSNAFGVRTRDFALTPRKSPSKLTKEATARAPSQAQLPPSSKLETRKQSGKARSKASTPAIQKSRDSEFDEEAFKRKQTEARAALERLQKSLSEDFINLPDRETVKNKKDQPAAETRAAASSILPTHESKTIVTNIHRSESEKPPPSSFRTARDSQQRQPTASNSRSLSSGSRSSKRAGAPSLLKNIEPATNPIDENMLSPALLQALQMTSNPPRSPGEISLSAFPVPSSSRPPSQPDVPAGFHSHANSLVGMMKRRNSTKSQSSTGSIFSIPYHMVPGRTSSVKDPVPEEVEVGYG